MKRQAVIVLTTLSLLVMLTAASAPAQSDLHLEVNVPFAFSVGNSLLPPGEYTVRYGAQGLLMIQSADRRVAKFFITISTQAGRKRDDSVLIFNQYGDQYFLSTIWTAGDYFGQELRKPQAERRLIRASRGMAQGASERQTVSIVANR